MQSLPQPPSQPTVEGCPVVELPDAEADVKFVLRALYTPTLLAEPALPLSTVGALIRLGRKYDFKDLFNSALRRLAFEKPHILQGIGGSTRGPPIYSNAHHFISSPGFYFDTVTLLSENRLWSLLPCACFRLVTMRNATQLFDGVSREDGALASLSFVDLRRCVAGREFLLAKQFQPGYTFGWSRGWKCAKCTDPPQCAHTHTVIIEVWSDDPAVPPSMYEFSEIWDSLCPACCKQVKSAMVAGLKRIWEELPRAFGFPAWNELKDGP